MGKLDHFQPAWARRTLCRLSLAALMLLPTAFSVAADSAPRGIGDITGAPRAEKLPAPAKGASAQTQHRHSEARRTQLSVFHLQASSSDFQPSSMLLKTGAAAQLISSAAGSGHASQFQAK